MDKDLRNTLVLAAIALAAGSYMYFVESRKPEKTAEEGKPDDTVKVVSLEAASVEEILIEGAAPMNLRQTAPEVWEVDTKEKAFPGDPGSIGDLITSLSLLKGRKIEIPAGAADSDFGLEKPAVKLTVKRKTLPPVVIAAGGESPISGSQYLRVDGATYVVQSYDLNPLQRTAEDFRNKQLVKADPAKVYKVEIAFGGAIPDDRVLLREAGGWKFHRSIDGKVDVNHLEDFLSELRILKAWKFSGKGEESLKEYGLDVYRLDVKLYGEKGELLDSIRFGVLDPETQGSWVWSQNYGEIVQITKFSMDQMPQTPTWLTVNEKKAEEKQGDSAAPMADPPPG